MHTSQIFYPRKRTARLIDTTGIEGTFDISLHWSPDDAHRPADVAPLSSEPSIDEAIQEQLGLKLEPRKAPLEYLVVVHAEKPSAN